MRQCNVVEIPQSTSMYWGWVFVLHQKSRYMYWLAFKMLNLEIKIIMQHSSIIAMRLMRASFSTNTKYPPLDENANFTKYQLAQFYKYMTEFARDYYGMDPLVSGTAIQPNAYKELALLFVFDDWKQCKCLNNGVLNITMEMQFSE